LIISHQRQDLGKRFSEIENLKRELWAATTQHDAGEGLLNGTV
jgi:hypothetical protein